jgi:hypothetical protein
MLDAGKLIRSEAPKHLSRTSEQNPPDDANGFCVEIAGIRVAVDSGDPEMRLGVSETIQRFAVDRIDADVHIQVFRGDPGLLAGGRKLFDSGLLWQLYANREKCQFRFFSSALGAQPYNVATFSSDFTRGEIHLPRDRACAQRAYPFEYPLNELLFISLLAQGRGVEVHASGLIDPQGNGRLFLGQSGAGKTTISGLWQRLRGVQILSDDRIILRKERGRIWMHGTPWHGEGLMALPARAPLTQICFLRHSSSNALVAQGKAEAVARMFACTFPPFYSPEGIDFTMKFLEAVADSVPCYELGFLPDESAVKFLGEAQLASG